MSDSTTHRVLVRSWATVGTFVALWMVGLVLARIWPACQLLLGGAIVGFACSPVTNWLEDRHVPRGMAALLALLLVLGVLAGVAIMLVPPVIDQVLELLRLVPDYVSRTQDAFYDFLSRHPIEEGSDLNQVVSTLVTSLSGVFTGMAGEAVTKLSGGAITNIVGTLSDMFTFFLSLVMAYWLAKDYPRIVRELTVIAGPDHRDGITMLLAVTSRSMGGYMRGIVITSFVGGFLSFLGFTLIGHPYAGLMGITVGVLHFIPVIGPWCAAFLACGLALFVSPMLAVETLLVSVVAQNVTDNLVSPLVMQSAVKVHPVLSLFAIILGNAVGGVLGMALAIPLSAAIKGVFVYYFESKTGRQLVSYEGALFRGSPFHDAEGNAMPSFDALDDDKFFEHTRLVPADSQVSVERDERPAGTEDNLVDLLRSKYAEKSVASAGEESARGDDGADDGR